jgi:hypothetical protein
MSPTLQDELMARRQAAIAIGSVVELKRPFTEEPANGVVVSRQGERCLVACCGEEVEYLIGELTPKGDKR